VIMVTGVGRQRFADADRNQGRRRGFFKKNPGMKVVARYTGMWDSSTANSATRSTAASLPKVDGIWVQGGSDGVLKAFIDAKRTPASAHGREAEKRLPQVHAPAGLPRARRDWNLNRPATVPRAGIARACSRSAAQAAREGDIEIPSRRDRKTVKLGKTVFPNLATVSSRTSRDSGPNGHRRDLCPGRPERKGLPGHLESESAK